MKYILCYGDSNTWGAKPETFKRYEWGVRWTSVMQFELGEDYHVYENALNGRTTVFEDAIEEGRNGKTGFDTTLEENSPLDLIIVMLGTNDVKLRFNLIPWDIGWGMDLLIKYIKRASCGRDRKNPQILIASPVVLGNAWSKTILGTVFDSSSTQKSKKLFEIYKKITERNECHIFNAAEYATPGSDCVHITEESHLALGKAFAKKVKDILG